MKKITILLISIAFAVSSFGQAIENGTTFLGLGVGPGISYTAVSGLLPAVKVFYEKGVFEAGPGVITAGGVVGYNFAGKFSDSGTNTTWNWATGTWQANVWEYTRVSQRFAFGVRSNYYYNFGDLLNTPEFSAYAGITLGAQYRLESINYKGDPPYLTSISSSVAPLISFRLGACYYFAESTAAFVEVANGVNDISWTTVGLNFRF